MRVFLFFTWSRRGFRIRSVALMVERRIPNPRVGGSSPSWPVET